MLEYGPGILKNGLTWRYNFVKSLVYWWESKPSVGMRFHGEKSFDGERRGLLPSFELTQR